jgi:Protein of unknown function (DUF3800)
MLTARLAMFGGPLRGDLPVRYIFIDEAGISANEPISVVAGIIVHADKQCAPAEEAIENVLDLIPDHKRAQCAAFSAKKIWGDEKLRENWPLDERMHLLKEMMSIPRKLKLAVAFGTCLRTTQLPENLLKDRGITLVQAHHGLAFQECVARTDSWINKYARYNEVATVIAEDVPESKNLLRRLAKHLLTTHYNTSPKNVRVVHYGTAAPNVREFKPRNVSRIRLPIHFVEKQDEALLLIADACAFGFRRFLSRQSRGQDFANAILGRPVSVDQFPIDEWSSGIFGWGTEVGGFNVSYAGSL